jgi:hypothetical protein
MTPPDYSFYPEHMRPVSFPTADAEAAIEVCDRIAGLLNDHLLARPEFVGAARDGWEGACRDQFDETWRLQEVRLGGLKEDLQRLSGNIATAMENVRATNSVRTAQRVEYLADQTETATG